MCVLGGDLGASAISAVLSPEVPCTVPAGGTVFGDESLDLKLEEIKPSDFGQVGEVVVTKDDTLMMRGAGKEEDVQRRVEQIQETIEVTTSSYEKEKLQERLGRLANGVAVLRVRVVMREEGPSTLSKWSRSVRILWLMFGGDYELVTAAVSPC